MEKSFSRHSPPKGVDPQQMPIDINNCKYVLRECFQSHKFYNYSTIQNDDNPHITIEFNHNIAANPRATGIVINVLNKRLYDINNKNDKINGIRNIVLNPSKQMATYIDANFDILHANNYICFRGLCANPAMINIVKKRWTWLIETDHLFGYNLCQNPAAIDLIEEHWDYLFSTNNELFAALSKNPCGLEILEKHKDKLFKFELIHGHIPRPIELGISFYDLSKNTGAAMFIETNWDWLSDNNKIHFDDFYQNPGMIDLIEKKWDWLVEQNKMNYDMLCANPMSFALLNKKFILSKYKSPSYNCHVLLKPRKETYKPQLISIAPFLHNTSAIDFILETFTPEDIYMNERNVYLLFNKSERAMDFIQKHFVHFSHFNNQHNKTISIFNPLYRFGSALGFNPEIFVDEYYAVAKKWVRGPLSEELMARIWHPRNIHRFASWGIDL